MENFLANPAFETYAFCSSILAFKMLYSAVHTGQTRSRHQGYVNSEDANVFGPAGSAAADVEHPAVAHALRIQRNDLESIPLFFVVGLLFVLTGGTPWWTWLFCWTYTLSRLAHTYFYQNHMQPHRAISFVIGTSATVLMALRVFWTTL